MCASPWRCCWGPRLERASSVPGPSELHFLTLCPHQREAAELCPVRSDVGVLWLTPPWSGASLGVCGGVSSLRALPTSSSLAPCLPPHPQRPPVPLWASPVPQGPAVQGDFGQRPRGCLASLLQDEKSCRSHHRWSPACPPAPSPSAQCRAHVNHPGQSLPVSLSSSPKPRCLCLPRLQAAPPENSACAGNTVWPSPCGLQVCGPLGSLRCPQHGQACKRGARPTALRRSPPHRGTHAR